MSTATLPTTRQRRASRRQEAEVLSRLQKATGQLGGVTSVYDDGRSCIDVLGQLLAVTAAGDVVAVLILPDRMNACICAASDPGDTEDTVPELVTAIRRYVRSR